MKESTELDLFFLLSTQLVDLLMVDLENVVFIFSSSDSLLAIVCEYDVISRDDPITMDSFNACVEIGLVNVGNLDLLFLLRGTRDVNECLGVTLRFFSLEKLAFPRCIPELQP